MNQLTWRFGFADENFDAGENWKVETDDVAEKIANEYAEDVKKHLLRLLTYQYSNRTDTQSKMIKLLEKILNENQLIDNKNFTKEANNKLTLLFRGHYQELSKEKWFRNYESNSSDPDFASDYSEFENSASDYFDYENWKEMDTWRRKLMKATGAIICPYCDRQYITSFSDDNGNSGTLATLDHFYAKAKHRLFAFSLFNFIPVCYGCNSVIKKDKDLNIYPYEMGYDNLAHFVLKPPASKDDNAYKKAVKFVDIILNEEKGKFNIAQVANDSDLKDDVNNDINTLRLNDVYDIHKDYVRDLLIIRRFYENSAYRSHLENILKDTIYPGKISYPVTVDMLRRFMIGGEWQDIEESNEASKETPQKRPLTKLTNAILKDEYKILFDTD